MKIPECIQLLSNINKDLILESNDNATLALIKDIVE